MSFGLRFLSIFWDILHLISDFFHSDFDEVIVDLGVALFQLLTYKNFDLVNLFSNRRWFRLQFINDTVLGKHE